MSHLAIGISGEIAAGKTTAAEALERFGFGYTRISKVIDKTLVERGLERSRANHQEIGLELHNAKGQAWLCEQAIALLGAKPGSVVLDGLRWRDDVTYMRHRYGSSFVHLHIVAPEVSRKRRFESDGKGIPYENVVSHPVEQGVAALAEMADRLIVNDGTKEMFMLNVVGFILERQIDAR